ncbi:MAG TPA: circularly permuted type 2 ATP-grasp protein, partial [Steroidobacteraceae bacterium]|nr:circularly permuted type 2 ATP-grasp protein [Steroidobacteraceae bacterium]
LANALGSGVLESPAWLGFMPAIAERLLGEPLRLPSVTSWWCGEGRALGYVTDHLEQLLIKASYPNQRFEPQRGGELDARARTELIAHLRAQPHAYVAQEPLALSQGPSLRSDGQWSIVARSLSLRVYALVGADTCAILPGGLARVAGEQALDVVSNQRGGGSKDLWVLPRDPGMELHEGPVRLRASFVHHEQLPSRLAENLYWFGRYSSRCEDKARLLRATLASRMDAAVYQSAVGLCRELGAAAADVDPSAALLDDLTPHGIITDAHRLAWCASQIRSRLSATYWRTIAELQSQLVDGTRLRGDPRNAIEGLLLSLAAFAGLALDDMRQDEGWRLLSVGRRIERLQFCSRLLGGYLASPFAAEQAHVEWLLSATDSLRIYRPRYAVAPRLAPMLDLLLRDAEHPRSLQFQEQALSRDLAALPRQGDGPAALRLESLPSLSDADLAALESELPLRGRLVSALRTQGESTERLSDRLSMRYFSHTRLDSHALAS